MDGSASAIMGVETAGFAPGTAVWGTDYNAAYSLLFRWFGLFEAPAEADLSPLWRDLGDEDLAVATPEIDATGIDAVGAAVAKARAGVEFSHRVGYDDVSLAWLGDNQYQLDATATIQRRENDSVETRREVVRAIVRKRADGRLVSRSLTSQIEERLPEEPFGDMRAINRAKATLVQFQTHTDLLTGDAEPMRELLMPELELYGLVNSKADSTKADAATFTDVRNLREAISREDKRHDNVIRTFAEFSSWFSSCTALFQKDGFHKLEHIEVKPLGNDRFQATAQFHWMAQTVNGAPISLHTPLTWVLAETGDTYMRIEKLLPFG